MKLFLASQSPRRRLLLEESGVAFEYANPGVDDSGLRRGGVSPEQWVASLAYLKASAGCEILVRSGKDLDEYVILGADTVVVKDGAVIGQPKDAVHAAAILRVLEQGEHDVLTGVALLRPGDGQREMMVDSARVRVGPLDAQKVAKYLASGQWAGKAGAYNLAERQAEGWPITCEGDPGTVMGLPMRVLLPRLARMGVRTGGPAGPGMGSAPPARCAS